MSKVPLWLAKPELYLFNAKVMSIVFVLSFAFLFVPTDSLPKTAQKILMLLDSLALFGSSGILILIGFSSVFDAIYAMIKKSKK